MDTVRNMLMFYVVKLLVPESPAYGNTIPFIKQQSIEEIIPTLQVGDIIFTKTNSSWYELSRRLLQTNYDHVSVVINKNQVIHISPPIISKLEISCILVPSRQPLIVRLPLTASQSQTMLSILNSFIGQKYNQSAIPTMFKNQIISRLFEAQRVYEFTFQNMKYSKICTQAILYSLFKSQQSTQKQLEKYINQWTQFKKLGFIMPDQMLAFINTRKDCGIIFKSPRSPQQKMMITKIQQCIDLVMSKIGFLTDGFQKLSNTQTAHILKQITKIFKNNLLKQHPLTRVLSILAILVQLKYGGKLNKYLLIYSILATFMVFRVMPEQTNFSNFIPIFKRLAKL